MFRRIVGRPVGLIVAAAAVAALIAGIAMADAGSPPAFGYVSITPVQVFGGLSGGSIGANKGVFVTAIGGSTTVPMDATAVRLQINVKDAQAGQLQIYPAGDPTAGGATTVPFSANVQAGAFVNETVGTKSQITIVNRSGSTATVAVSVIGYSTEIAATNIAPDGGNAGQVLTDSGGGVSWQTPAILTKAYENSNTQASVALSPAATLVTVASVSVPAGAYVITFTGTTANGTDSSFDTTQCRINDGAGLVSGGNDTTLPQSSISSQTTANAFGATTFTVKCEDGSGHERVVEPELIATQVGSLG
jgi:hypothetical protein